MRAIGGSDKTVEPFEAAKVRQLAEKYDLMATDASIEAAAAIEP